MGSSYSATCYALVENKAIDSATRARLLSAQKTIKQSLVHPYAPKTWYGDVWLVTDRDNGMVLEGSRNDLVVLRLTEHPSSGYLWQFGDLADAGLEIKQDRHTATSGTEHLGGIVFRTVVAESRQEEHGAVGHISLTEERPWQVGGKPLQSVEFDLELRGPLQVGLLTAQRDALLALA
jgi:predicted secreted protein